MAHQYRSKLFETPFYLPKNRFEFEFEFSLKNSFNFKLTI